METLAPGLSMMRNVHPATVHLPIALWLVAFGFLAAGAASGRSWVLRSGRILLHLGTLTGIVAVFTGLIAAQTLAPGTPGLDHLGSHRAWMLATTGLSILASLTTVILLERRPAAARWAPAFLALLIVVASAIGADRGGLLVYGYGTGTSVVSPGEDPLPVQAPRKAPAPLPVLR